MTLDVAVCFAEFQPGAVIRVSGEDTLAFLQGQFTQELRSPSPNLAAYGLWLNQKGKVIADSYALHDGDVWWLLSVSSPAKEIVDRLSAYIIADDVDPLDVTARWVFHSIWGLSAANFFRQTTASIPLPGEWARLENGFLFRELEGSDERWILSTPREGLTALSTKLLEFGGRKVSGEEFEIDRIQRGRPRVPIDLGPGDLPNEAGLEHIAVSYSKGCYLGQEVMARLHAMGQVRRKLLRFRGAGEPPRPGDALYVGEKKIGEARSSVAIESGFIGLAMINLFSLPQDRRAARSPNGSSDIMIEDAL